MYIVTGILKEDGKEVAYGLYETESKRTMIMARGQVRKMVAHGVYVTGFERVESTISDKVYVRKDRGYIWRTLPELNGKGESEDKNKQVLVGTNGYKEMRAYVTVNSLGKVYVYYKEDMVEQLKQNNIVGAVLASDGRVIPYITNQVSDIWLIEQGWKREEGLIWHRINSAESKQPEQTEEVPRKHYVVGLHH